MACWIGEALLGITGMFIFLPITALVLLRLFSWKTDIA
jgi:hypothetical protein